MSAQTLLLVAPPMSQLNTPYPATAYLTGFLRRQGLSVHQADLSLETALGLFSRPGLRAVFDALEDALPRIEAEDAPFLEEARAFLTRRARYEGAIESVIRFLQDKDSTLAHRLSIRGTLPEGPRFHTLPDLERAFGDVGIRDQARYLCTLFLDDIADLVTATLAPEFRLTRYGERLASSQASFDLLAEALAGPPTLIDTIFLDALDRHLDEASPDVVGFSCPFPGNVLAALRGGAHIKARRPGVTVILGGGYVNTELRQLKEPRIFDCVDYLTLDDGEAPLLQLLAHLRGEDAPLKRTFLRRAGAVVFEDAPQIPDVPHRLTGAPSYAGLPTGDYLSVLEVLNPMHRLWGDGRWNKLTLAHGCYWKKCAFCDIHLDYIGRYDPAPAAELVDRMDAVNAETGISGFHFVDEAAPPHLLKALAIELLRRGRFYSWWGNIRFEARFDADLCRLLAASGAIAVSGGLEVASDRLLAMMAKGVTVTQVAQVARNFTQSGVLVHAYLMYGFPTQTDQETLDSLERVRQLFEAGVIQSGFWHRFVATAHSPVGQDPGAFGVRIPPAPEGPFALNDLPHEDPRGGDHDRFSAGLELATYNFMNGQGFDQPARSWFGPWAPKSRVPGDLIQRALLSPEPPDAERLDRRALWLGASPALGDLDDGLRALHVSGPDGEGVIWLPDAQARWLGDALHRARPDAGAPPRLSALLDTFPGGDAAPFLQGDDWAGVRAVGLVLI